MNNTRMSIQHLQAVLLTILCLVSPPELFQRRLALHRHFAPHNSEETAAGLHALMVFSSHLLCHNIHTDQVKVTLLYISHTLPAYGCHWTQACV